MAGDKVFSPTLCRRKCFGRGEDPQRQDRNEAEICIRSSLTRGEVKSLVAKWVGGSITSVLIGIKLPAIQVILSFEEKL
jgi:hypothetical protein